MSKLARRIYWIPGCPPTTHSETNYQGAGFVIVSVPDRR